MLQETVDELESSGDESGRADLKSQIAAKRGQIATALTALFERTADGAPSELLQELQSQLNCQRYLERLWERLS